MPDGESRAVISPADFSDESVGDTCACGRSKKIILQVCKPRCDLCIITFPVISGKQGATRNPESI